MICYGIRVLSFKAVEDSARYTYLVCAMQCAFLDLDLTHDLDRFESLTPTFARRSAALHLAERRAFRFLRR